MENFSALLTYLQDPETPYGLLDPVYSLYLMYGFVLGLFRGLPEELAHVAGTALVAVGAWFFYQPVSAVMIEHTQLESEEASLALAYLLMILLFFVVWRVLITLIRKALDWTCPQPLYRPGGALLGLAKCGLVIIVILTLVQLSGHSLLNDHLITRSWLGRAMGRAVPEQVHEVLPDWVPSPADAPLTEEPATEPEDGSGDA
jgi:uncharacterized membrane protein required for colicin V production